jgi:hypothetical protein
MSDPLANLDTNLSGDGGLTAYTGQVYLGTKKVPGFTTQSPTGGTYTVKPRKGESVVSAAEAKRSYLTDDKLRTSWLQTLKKNGITTDPIKARALWDLSVDGASDWFATSNGTQKVTPEQYLGWYTGGQKKAPKPDLSRSVYEYAPEQIAADIDKVAQNVLGRTINDEDKAADWYTDLTNAISKMASKGTVTTVEDVRNPKTGKLERVTKQSPKFTTEKAKEKITSTLREASPVDVERKERVDFTKWLFTQMGGQD